MSKTLIRFTAINRKTRVTRPCWVAGARFADGDGSVKVKSVSTTFDREKAARWSTSTAYAIALQFCSTPAVLELVDGTPLVDETQRLLEEQAARVAASVALNAQFCADMEQMLSELPILRDVLRQRK